jgi:MFS family permease
MLSKVKGYPLKAFFVCLAAYTTAQMDLALFGYAIPSIRAEFDLSLSGVTAIVSSAFVIGGLLLVWFALLADRIGRKKLFIFSMIGSSLLVAMQSIVATPTQLIAVRGASIATGGLTYPVTGAILAEEFPARYRGLFLGFMQCGYPLGWALASVAAAYILQFYNWRYLFLVGLVSLPLVWLVNRVLHEPHRSVEARANANRDGAGRVRLTEMFAPGIRHRTILLFCAQFLLVWA